MLMYISRVAADKKKKKELLLSLNELVYFAKEEYYTVTTHLRSN